MIAARNKSVQFRPRLTQGKTRVALPFAQFSSISSIVEIRLTEIRLRKQEVST